MPRTTRSMATPAREARYNASMISGSASAFSLAQIAAGRPARACAASASINSKSVARSPCGAQVSFSIASGGSEASAPPR